MLRNKRKTIGIFIADVFSEFQREVCFGITERGKELGYNTFYFSCFGAYGQEAYGIGEMNIAELPNMKDLDGVIFAPGTYAIEGMENHILERFKREAVCPLVTVGEDFDDYPCVMIDNDHVLEELIEHFIYVHKFTRINFISGPKTSMAAIKRLECYKRILEKHGIYDERRVYYGDFWRKLAADAVDFFLDEDMELPQVIICANDSMAVTACIELTKRGIRIPEDIAVSGCDNMELASSFIPTLTTADVPVREMGVEALDKIHRILTGQNDERISYAKTSCVLGESCGCRSISALERMEQRSKILETSEWEGMEYAENMYMSIDLQNAARLSTIYECIVDKFIHFFPAQELYLCLSEDWRQRGRETEAGGYADRMQMVFGVKGENRIQPADFNKNELLPECLWQEEPMSYYFVPIHYRTKSYGYAITGFRKNEIFLPSSQAFFINISNAIENYCVREELTQVAAELEDMYIHDVLTGLYNRRGFQLLAQKYFEETRSKGKQIFILGADVNDLKVINDTFGHLYGDIAIQAVANALSCAAKNSEICARCGGDEFSVIGMDYSETKVVTFVRDFVDALEIYNRTQNRPFHVSASWGTVLVAPNREHRLEDLINEADKQMYENKKRSKQNRKMREERERLIAEEEADRI